MKRLLVLISLLTIFSFGLIAEEKSALSPEKTESKWTSLSYENVPILKILEARNGYLVIYQKNHYGVGSVVIPKDWAKGNPETPRKLKFRNAKTVNSSFLTYVRKDGKFLRVILTVPASKRTSIWGVVDTYKDLDGCDIDSLEELAL